MGFEVRLTLSCPMPASYHLSELRSESWLTGNEISGYSGPRGLTQESWKLIFWSEVSTLQEERLRPSTDTQAPQRKDGIQDGPPDPERRKARSEGLQLSVWPQTGSCPCLSSAAAPVTWHLSSILLPISDYPTRQTSEK